MKMGDSHGNQITNRLLLVLVLLIFLFFSFYGRWWPFQAGHHELSDFVFKSHLVQYFQVNWDELATYVPIECQVSILDGWEVHS